ncbi:uncharacterized protein NPIL_690111 [Nephila pilipes]|uniref:DNA-directed RNA polymerase III subunit RPC4 n=1 Tax=Nephila pilipes TaxID=299642 RepID=A0A8X6TV43_NEPPI|nr:uncharacterized protein NPIL_690111 [Nephila pilipes]
MDIETEFSHLRFVYILECISWHLLKLKKKMSQPPEDKKPDFSSFPRGAIGLKGLPVGRNARLPSIRTPRDLTLGAQPKRTFMPNIPVRREKKVVDPIKSTGQSSSEISPKLNHKNVTPKAERGRGRGKSKAQIIQLEGSVFGEGIAASTSKAGRQREYIPKSEFFSGRVSSVKKEKSDFEMKNMAEEMKNLLRDDFIDDGDDSNCEESIKPVIFPIKETKIKNEKIEKGESFQNQDFAKEMGFDIQKIAKFIKKEKTDEEKVPVVKPDLSKVPQNEITQLVTNNDSPFFLLELPECITAETADYQPKEQSVPETSNEKKNATNLSSMPDGRIGKLQILKSGRVRLKLSSLYYYLDVKYSLKTKHEIVSIKTDSNPGEIITLGNCESKISILPDINSLMPCIL